MATNSNELRLVKENNYKKIIIILIIFITQITAIIFVDIHRIKIIIYFMIIDYCISNYTREIFNHKYMTIMQITLLVICYINEIVKDTHKNKISRYEYVKESMNKEFTIDNIIYNCVYVPICEEILNGLIFFNLRRIMNLFKSVISTEFIFAFMHVIIYYDLIDIESMIVIFCIFVLHSLNTFIMLQITNKKYNVFIMMLMHGFHNLMFAGHNHETFGYIFRVLDLGVNLCFITIFAISCIKYLNMLHTNNTDINVCGIILEFRRHNNRDSFAIVTKQII